MRHRRRLPNSRIETTDLVAHCANANRGSYINSLVITDIASGWPKLRRLCSAKAASLLGRIRRALPFALRAFG
jgi:hypothetical protein